MAMDFELYLKPCADLSGAPYLSFYGGTTTRPSVRAPPFAVSDCAEVRRRSSSPDDDDGCVSSSRSSASTDSCLTTSTLTSDKGASTSWVCDFDVQTDDRSSVDGGSVRQLDDSDDDDDDVDSAIPSSSSSSWSNGAGQRRRHTIAPALLSQLAVIMRRPAVDNDDGDDDGGPPGFQPGHLRRRPLSLPANLMSFSSGTAHVDKRTESKQLTTRRRRFSAGVKFADEMGENLTTFAIIPSRHDDLHKSRSTSTLLGRSNPTTTTNNRGFPAVGRHRVVAACQLPSHDDVSASDDDDNELTLFPVSNRRHRHPSPERRRRCAPDAGDTPSPRPSFRLAFDQPAADRVAFERRLDEQLICLENVKVVDSSTAGWDAALCCVRVKRCVRGAELCWGSPRVRVFARCTDDEWESYADIAAHRVGPSVQTTGCSMAPSVVRETFTFAVRRPLEASGTAADCLAVEFALCYEDEGKQQHWDNNGCRNYRIEWIT